MQGNQLAVFDHDNIQLAEALAEMVALAINDAQLQAETQQTNSSLNTLFTVTRMINRSLLLEDVLSQALSSVLMSFDFEVGFITLINPIDGQHQMAIETNLPSILSREDQHNVLLDTLCTYVSDHRQSLVWNEATQDALIVAEVGMATTKLASFGLRAGICIPLLYQDRILGVLGIFTHQSRLLSMHKTTLFNSIGHQVGAAIANAQLFQINAKYKFVVNASGEPMSLIGQDYTYELVNDAYCLTHNKTPDEIIGKSVADIWGEDRFQAVIKPNLDKCFAGKEVRYQAWFELSALGDKHLDVMYSPYYDENGEITHAVVVSRDITERKQIEEQLFHRAFHDTLTNLPNRILFMEQLGGALNQAKWEENYLFAVLFIDLDRFKNINDSLGHMIGDQLLIKIARRLEICVRPQDTVARLGGDEFTILLDNIRDIDEAQQVAERIKNELAKPIDLQGHVIFTTASIGITANIRKYERPEDLLRDADIAMYEAKSEGKARHALFDTGQHTRVAAQRQLETDLWQALKRQEFQVYYQPIVSLATGELVGAEALLRWQHPQQGLLKPNKFIALAEETGLIVPIGEWLLDTACTQAQIWRKTKQRHLELMINMSARQLQQPNMLSFIDDVLEKSGLMIEALVLEITEGVGTQNVDLEILTRLHDKGIKLAIDDFGISSSFKCLKQFPLTTLKIDRSFVKGLANDQKDQTIITTMISMAHSLDLRVVAEGVETEEQVAFLRSQQCDAIQGYLFGQPMQAESLTELF